MPLFAFHMANFTEQKVTPPELIRQVRLLQHANQQLHHAHQQSQQQMAHLMGQQNQQFNNLFPPPQVPHPLAPRPNLNLPQPKFHGQVGELKTF